MGEKLHFGYDGNSEMTGDEPCDDLIFIHLAGDFRFPSHGLEQTIHHTS